MCIFVLIPLCGIAAKVFVFLIWDSVLLVSHFQSTNFPYMFQEFYYCFAIFNVILLCLYIPLHSSSGKFRMSYRNNYIIYTVVAIIHGLILVIGIVHSSGFENTFGCIFFQVYYSLFTLSVIDFLVGWKGCKEHYDVVPVRRYRQSDKGNQMLVTGARRLIKDYVPVPKDASENHRTAKPSKCPICSSDTATVRILTECGHTVCEGCARKILERTCKIKCPVCRKVTIVDETKRIYIPVSMDVEPSAPVEVLEDRRPENRTASHCECQICTEEYSDTIIPRILSQCGHTVCEECARKLLGHQGNITCPVCREETNVDGRVENLPKNFAVIEMTRGNLNA
ncbi:hypothetical protein CRE_19502 [Caenorhabditis remanei]|uniref:RING-type domain-containing protein n=1 Tax=Caenorhabditis remanei TaxID=31234 RepID=E3NG75_CAERE|nr:hypothetical protein CRE_19502 [Caenorhabditis remanei]